MSQPLDTAVPLVVRATNVRYAVLAALCLTTIMAYVDRFCISVPAADLQRELQLTDQQLGRIMSAFFLSYALFQVPAGWLGQVWGTRRALPFFAILWSLFTALGAWVNDYHGLLWTRLGMGAAQAGLFPCTTSSLARWFPSTRRAFVNGVLGSFMGIGGALGTALSGVLLLSLAWRELFLLYAVPGLLWAVWFFFWFRDRPQDHPAVNAAELELIRESSPVNKDEAREPTGPTPWWTILTSNVMGWICAQQFFRAAGYVFYATWFPLFLQEARGVAAVTAGMLSSLPLVAQVLGSLIGGVVSDALLVCTGSRRLARQGLAAVSQLCCAGLIVIAFFVADATSAVLIITTGSFCASLTGPIAYSCAIDLGGRYVAPVFSLMNMAGNLGAVGFPLVVAGLKDTTGNWDLVLLVFAGTYLLAALCWLPFNPNRPIVSE